MHRLSVLLLLLFVACASVPPRDVSSEARAFMEVYAGELRAGDESGLCKE